MAGVDPVAIARFMLLPGAGELLDAFSRIPEGRVRESLIHHAQMLAGEYHAGPVESRPPDPIQAFASATVLTAPVLTAPVLTHDADTAEFTDGTMPRPKPRSVEEEVIQRRLDGEWPVDIATEMKLQRNVVNDILQKARKLGGIEFPSLIAHPKPEAPQEPAKPAKAPKPREPKVWPTPYAKQDWFGQKMTRFMAKQAGLSVEEQQAREAHVVARFKEGAYPVQLEKELGVGGHIITTIRKRAMRDGVRLPPLAIGGGARKAMGRPSDPRAMQEAKREREAAEAREAEPVQARLGAAEA